MKKLLLPAIIIIAAIQTNAQNIFPSSGRTGIGTTVPNSSSLLEIKSTSKGLLIPRMTQAQRNAIDAPATGLMIFQTDKTPGFYYYNGSLWLAVTPKKANTSLSNLDSVTSVNADLQPANSTLNIGGINNSWQNVYANNFISGGSYSMNITGSVYKVLNFEQGNTFFGTTYNTTNTGYANSFVGNASGSQNTTGNSNTAIGQSSLNSNTTGSGNTVTGVFAMLVNTTGSYNTAGGADCMNKNTLGSDNTAYGVDALYNNTSAGQNVAIGTGALYYQAYSNNNTQYSTRNTAVGFNALNHNNPTSFNGGLNNTAVGWGAQANNTSGFENVALGENALPTNTTGHSNTAVGNSALSGIVTGLFNTAVGFGAGVTGDGTGISFFGAYAASNSGTYTNSTALGYSAHVTNSNQVRIGNASTTSIGGYVGFSNISDGRVKKNIKQNVPGLAFINKLQPVTYNLDLDAADKIIQYQRKDSTGKIIPLTQLETEARKAKEQILYTGFIAQDVEKAAKSLKYDFSGVDAAKNSKDLYGLRYAEFVVPLVKAVQELSKQNDIKEASIDTLKQMLALQQQEIDALKAMITSSPATQQSTFISSASLAQNIPNPFNNSTSISYMLPQIYSSASIIVTDAKGVVLKQISLNAKGKGNAQLDASTLASGAYRYSLYVDGKLIDSKQMISSK